MFSIYLREIEDQWSTRQKLSESSRSPIAQAVKRWNFDYLELLGGVVRLHIGAKPKHQQKQTVSFAWLDYKLCLFKRRILMYIVSFSGRLIRLLGFGVTYAEEMPG